jgi:hypothetical protein
LKLNFLRTWSSESINTFEDKLLQWWFGFVIKMNRTRILRRTLELKFKAKRPMG